MKTGLFIGRFQPMHEGHIHAIKEAASQVDLLCILVGSVNLCRSIKNPWKYNERYDLIYTKLYENDINNIYIIPLNDYMYNDDLWVSDIHNIVETYSLKNPILFGHMKEGNNYLKWFPEWEFRNIESEYTINATEIRNEAFQNNIGIFHENVVEDFKFYEKERELFKNYPFPETLNFNCSDVILEVNNKFLLINRKNSPGKYTWALPGGFRNNNETFMECAIRELIEETNINLSKDILENSIVYSKFFDSPKRFHGILRNTYAFYFKVLNCENITVNAQDDAMDVKWFTLEEIMNELELYDDHQSIISYFTKVYPKPAHINPKFFS